MIKFFRSLALGALVLTLHGSLTPLQSQTNDWDVLTERYQGIVDTFLEQLTAAEQRGDVAEIAEIWNDYGEAQLYLKNYAAAQEATETALRLARTLAIAAEQEEQRLISIREYWYVRQLTLIHDRLGDPYGREFLERELSNAKRLHPLRYRIVLQHLAASYSIMQSTALMGRGVDVAQENVELAIQGGDVDEATAALRLLSGLLSLTPETQARAIAAEQRRYNILLEFGDASDQGAGALSLGATLQRSGQTDGAIAVMDGAIAHHLAQKAGEAWDLNRGNERSYFESFLNLQRFKAYLYQSQRNYDSAAQILAAVEPLARQYQAESYNPFSVYWTLRDSSEIRFWQGDRERALDYQLQTQASWDAVNPDVTQVFHSGSEVPPDPLYWVYAGEASTQQMLLGFLHLELGQREAAAAALHQALRLDTYALETFLQTMNNRSAKDYLNSPEGLVRFYNTGSDAYRLLQRLRLEQGDAEAALIASEQGRARGFLNLLQARFASEVEPPETPEQLTLAEIKAIARRENTTLVYYSLSHEAPQVWRDGQWGFHQRHQIQQLAVWVISPQGQITHQVVPLGETDLDELIQGMRRRLIASGQNNRAAPLLQKLHGLLIEPIAAHLPDDPAARVTFIPDHALFFVPFPALQDANGVELIERHTILTAPSIRVLGEARQNKGRLQPRDRALVIGNPKMPDIPAVPDGTRASLAPLPGAEAEAKAIATLLDTQPLIGAAATESRTVERMQTARVLHFATHGLLEANSNGYTNALALTPAGQDDGFLTVQEIITLQLNADLAVLSACDTGQGELANGEGVMGLSRAFMGAGAASIIVSLWAIPDQPTAILMTHFYEQLDAGVDSATALRQAMLATRQQFPAPSNWAAFTIMGAVD
ncbi:MAG: CHAT domain-containing protein [Cyanobacteria bacterium P01_G01_bin.54]